MSYKLGMVAAISVLLSACEPATSNSTVWVGGETLSSGGWAIALVIFGIAIVCSIVSAIGNTIASEGFSPILKMVGGIAGVMLASVLLYSISKDPLVNTLGYFLTFGAFLLWLSFQESKQSGPGS